MVRLWPHNSHPGRDGWNRFHSTMVRLKPTFHMHYTKQRIFTQSFFLHYLSLLFLSNLFSLSVLQSKMVLLNPGFWPRASVPCYDFHSTMVRLRPVQSELLQFRGPISIPLWFDWDNGSLDGFVPTKRQKFPFHYGSIETYSCIYSRPPWNNVSIPLWFDWDYFVIALATDEEVAISIPLWFDWDPAFTMLFFFIFIFYL